MVRHLFHLNLATTSHVKHIFGNVTVGGAAVWLLVFKIGPLLFKFLFLKLNCHQDNVCSIPGYSGYGPVCFGLRGWCSSATSSGSKYH